MKLVSFSNKRLASAEQGSFLTVSQTSGKMRITNKVAGMMGISAGSYVAVVGDEESGINYLQVGMKDDKAQVGNKVALQGASFEFTSTNVWNELAGETNATLKYEVAEEAIEFEGTKYWALGEVTRIERKKGEDKEEVAEEAVVTETTEAPEEEGFELS